MRYLVIAFALYLFSTIPATADAQPAILGAIDITDIQPLNNPEDIKGEYFPVRLSNPNLSLWEARNFCAMLVSFGTAVGSPSSCTGNYASLSSGFLGVEYRVFNRNTGRYKTMWKKY